MTNSGTEAALNSPESLLITFDFATLFLSNKWIDSAERRELLWSRGQRVPLQH